MTDGRTEVQAQGGRQAVAAIQIEDTEDLRPRQAVCGRDHGCQVEDLRTSTEHAEQRPHRCARDELRLEPVTIQEGEGARVAVARPSPTARDHDQLALTDLGLEARGVQGTQFPNGLALGLGGRNERGELAGRCTQIGLALEVWTEGFPDPPAVRRQATGKINICPVRCTNPRELGEREHVAEPVMRLLIEDARLRQHRSSQRRLERLDGSANIEMGLSVHRSPPSALALAKDRPSRSPDLRFAPGSSPLERSWRSHCAGSAARSTRWPPRLRVCG